MIIQQYTNAIHRGGGGGVDLHYIFEIRSHCLAQARY